MHFFSMSYLRESYNFFKENGLIKNVAKTAARTYLINFVLCFGLVCYSTFTGPKQKIFSQISKNKSELSSIQRFLDESEVLSLKGLDKKLERCLFLKKKQKILNEAYDETARASSDFLDRAFFVGDFNLMGDFFDSYESNRRLNAPSCEIK